MSVPHNVWKGVINFVNTLRDTPEGSHLNGLLTNS